MQTTLTEECQVHPGSFVLFIDKTDGMKPICDKCYAQLEKSTQQKNSYVTRQVVGEAIPTEDLIAQLRAPVKTVAAAPKNQDEEIQELSQKIY